MKHPKPTKLTVPVEVSVHEGAMFLREEVASCETPCGEKATVCLINMHTPAVDYKGHMYIFGLEELVRAVVEATEKAAGPERAQRAEGGKKK